MRADHVSLPLALPLSGTGFPQPLLLNRNRHKTTTHHTEAAVKKDLLVVQKKILPPKFNVGEVRIILLPRIAAPKGPDLISIIIVHSSARCHYKLIVIWRKIALNKGVVTSETTEHCKLLWSNFLLRVSQVLMCCLLKKSFMVL
jgi:hypothetical protein